MTTTADLIKARACSPSCIAATSTPRHCRCPCGGSHHGLLACADVTTLIAARAARLHHMTDLEVLTA